MSNLVRCDPISSYGCDKLATELNAYFLAHDYNLAVMGLRFFNVYGPNQRANSPYAGVITNFITKLLQNQPLVVFGDGNQTRDFVFVTDIVTNLLHAMQNLSVGSTVVNICSGRKTTINELGPYTLKKRKPITAKL